MQAIAVALFAGLVLVQGAPESYMESSEKLRAFLSKVSDAVDSNGQLSAEGRQVIDEYPPNNSPGFIKQEPDSTGIAYVLPPPVNRYLLSYVMGPKIEDYLIVDSDHSDYGAHQGKSGLTYFDRNPVDQFLSIKHDMVNNPSGPVFFNHLAQNTAF